MKHNIKYFLILSFVLSVLFFCSSYFLAHKEKSNKSFRNQTRDFNLILNSKENKAIKLIDQVLGQIKPFISSHKNNAAIADDLTGMLFSQNDYKELPKKEGIYLLMYEADSVIYWNSNSVEIPVSNLRSLNTEKILHLGNGWYDCIKENIDHYSVITLILIKHDYAYQNEYLNNNFLRDFGISSNVEISKDKGLYNVFSIKNDFLFSLNYPRNADVKVGQEYLINIFNLAGIIFLVIFLAISLGLIFKKDLSYLVSLTFILIILRTISFYFKIPHSFYYLQLFSPFLYANSAILPSLGDLLVDSVIVLLLSILTFSRFQITFSEWEKLRKEKSSAMQFFISFVSVFVLVSAFFIFIEIFRSLVFNSSILFNFTNILNLSVYSIVGLLIISFLLFTWYILTFIVVRINLSRLNYKKILIAFFINLLIFFIIYLIRYLNFHHPFSTFRFQPFDFFVNFIVPLIVISSVWYFETKESSAGTHKIRIRQTALFIVILSLFITFQLNKYNGIKENSIRKSLALKLAEERDPTADYLFCEFDENIQTDKTFLDYLKKFPDDRVEEQAKKYIQKKYFKGYWANYNIQITICESDDSLLVKPENINTSCHAFFSGLIAQTCKPSSIDNLYYRQSESVTNSYIATFTFITDKNKRQFPIDIFIEFDSKFVPRDLGYPRLLLDKRLNITNDYSNYAYAKYINNELIYQYGKIFYKSNLDSIRKTGKEFTFINTHRYNHLIYNPDKSTVFIVSRERENFIEMISPFSYLILFFSVVFLVLIISINYPSRSSLFALRSSLSLQRRIQYSMIIIVGVSFLLIGTLIIEYINRSNNDKNTEYLREKTHSMLIEVENKLSGLDSIQPSMNEFISGVLVNLSNIFFTDVNLYSCDGRLIASSRPKIFEEGLISKYMNCPAYFDMSFQNRTMLMQDENIGSLKFSSSYMPVRNIHNKTIAFLNLPYFTRQSEYKNEISTFFTTFINIYLILVALSIFIVWLISHYITSPLKLIRDKLSTIKFGSLNEKIEWSKNDELGKLISEYNKMIDELQKSAELLAKSERESAWREMAKQVAHEIKNPLTPMKLNVQHLRKISEERRTALDAQRTEHEAPGTEHQAQYSVLVDKITKTLIEQIDMLSDIATQFSDFAKLPLTHNEKVDISAVITNAIQLYHNYPNLQINFNNEVSGIKSENSSLFTLHSSLFVYADQKQLLRAFNNLIRNAVQAADTKDKAIIDIDLSVEKISDEKDSSLISHRSSPFLVIVKITDNGIGINDEQKDKIFSPNFTTKSGGTGLGLPMVKNIIESAGGKIWFESEPNNGTVFYIQLPVYK